MWRLSVRRTAGRLVCQGGPLCLTIRGHPQLTAPITMALRIFTACLGTETNSFSPIPTGMSVYQQTMLVRGGQHGERPGLFGLPLLRWKQQAQALGWTVAEGLATFAAPAGNTTRAAHAALRDEILADLQRALPPLPAKGGQRRHPGDRQAVPPCGRGQAC